MEVRSNKISDIRHFYKQKLLAKYNKYEADSLMFALFEEYAGTTKADIILYPEKTLSESELLKIHFGVKDLLNNKPLQYILGKAEFYGLVFEVNSNVLIPRPETEELVEMIIKENRDKTGLSILDIGTGSGCIAVTLKKHIPAAEVTAIDISASALEVAKKNAEKYNTEINFRLIDFLDERMREKLQKFDIIVSNPPYVRKEERKMMEKNVLDYEPSQALFPPEDDPLIFYKAIAGFGETHLLPPGSVYCELNRYLADETAGIFAKRNYIVKVSKDINDNDRILKAVFV